MSNFVALANDHCRNDHVAGSSHEISWPHMRVYSDLGCNFDDLVDQWVVGAAGECYNENFYDGMPQHQPMKAAQAALSQEAQKRLREIKRASRLVSLREEMEAAALPAIRSRHRRVVKRLKAAKDAKLTAVAGAVPVAKTAVAPAAKKNLRAPEALSAQAKSGPIKARRYNDDVVAGNVADDVYYSSGEADDYWWNDEADEPAFDDDETYFFDDLAADSADDETSKESLSLFGKWDLNYFSAAPTPAPTIMQGWFHMEAYSEPNAQGVVLASRGLATNKCQLVNGTSAETPVSIKYSCTSGERHYSVDL